LADDLSTSYTGSSTPYAILRRPSDGYVWDTTTSAFVIPVNGNIANYDITLTSLGLDLYAANVPGAVAAGSYAVDFYEYTSGTTPTISDFRLPSGFSFGWSGTIVSDPGSATLSDYALTTLDDAKRHMRITASTDDTLLVQLINSVSAEIERVCGTQFKARDRRLWLNLTNQRRLLLPNPPIQHVTRLAYGTANAISVTYSGSAITAQASVYRDPEDPDAGGIRLQTISTAGTATTTSLTFTLYPSLTAMKTAIDAVSGWSATVQVNRPSAELHVTGGESAKSRTVTFTYADQDYCDVYRLDNQLGHVEFATGSFGQGWWPADGYFGRRPMPSGFQEMFVQYRAGYETIPADVALVCREMVKEMWYAGKQNTGVKSSTLGPYSVTFNDAQEDRVRARLAKYMSGSAFVGGLV
jgi:hypothetical protein